MLRLLPIVLLLALAALPAAQAQTPADPKVTITLTAPSATTVVPLGGTAKVKVDVAVNVANVFCAQANTITVTLAPLGDSGIAGLTGTLPASVSVPLPPNVVPGGSFNQNVKGNATAVLEIAVVSTTMADHDHSFVVKASTAAGFPGDCKGINPTGPAAASAEKPVAVRTGPALASTTSGTASGGASGCSGASCTATQKSFFLPMQVQVLVLLAVGLLGRRRA